MEYKIITRKEVTQELKRIQGQKENKLLKVFDTLNQFLWSLGYRDIHSEMNKILHQVTSQLGIREEELTNLLFPEEEEKCPSP